MSLALKSAGSMGRAAQVARFLLAYRQLLTADPAAQIDRHAMPDPKAFVRDIQARELLAPSPLLDRIMREETQPKFERLSAIVAEITGVPVHDARMPQLVLSVIAPCLALLIVDRTAATPIQRLFGETAEALTERLWRFASAGLEQARIDDTTPGTACRPSGTARIGVRPGSTRKRVRG